MKAMIDNLKDYIELIKMDVETLHEEYKAADAEYGKSHDEESFDRAADACDAYNKEREKLSNLRRAIMYLRIANGEDAFYIDSFHPEEF